jgi:SPP1 gp7 family putative phage head morphogenesis protein
VTEFVWTTAGDERTRESHRAIDGQTFSWDDPPVVDNEEAIPGEPPNCRCVAFPVLPELDGAEESDTEAA